MRCSPPTSALSISRTVPALGVGWLSPRCFAPGLIDEQKAAVTVTSWLVVAPIQRSARRRWWLPLLLNWGSATHVVYDSRIQPEERKRHGYSRGSVSGV